MSTCIAIQASNDEQCGVNVPDGGPYCKKHGCSEMLETGRCDKIKFGGSGQGNFRCEGHYHKCDFQACNTHVEEGEQDFCKKHRERPQSNDEASGSGINHDESDEESDQEEEVEAEPEPLKKSKGKAKAPAAESDDEDDGAGTSSGKLNTNSTKKLKSVRYLSKNSCRYSRCRSPHNCYDLDHADYKGVCPYSECRDPDNCRNDYHLVRYNVEQLDKIQNDMQRDGTQTPPRFLTPRTIDVIKPYPTPVGLTFLSLKNLVKRLYDEEKWFQLFFLFFVLGGLLFLVYIYFKNSLNVDCLSLFRYEINTTYCTVIRTVINFVEYVLYPIPFMIGTYISNKYYRM